MQIYLGLFTVRKRSLGRVMFSQDVGRHHGICHMAVYSLPLARMCKANFCLKLYNLKSHLNFKYKAFVTYKNISMRIKILVIVFDY